MKIKILITLFILFIITFTIGLTYSAFTTSADVNIDQKIAKFVFKANQLDHIELEVNDLVPGDSQEYLFSITNKEEVNSDVALNYQIVIRTFHFMPLLIELYKVYGDNEFLIMNCNETYSRNSSNELVCNSPIGEMAKNALLEDYTQSCRHRISGRHFSIPLSALADDLERRAGWLTGYLREQEWIDGGADEGWFNSYYDNHGRAVEGFFPNEVRMMLTGQVFSIMGNVASDEQIRRITASADHYLYRKEIGGYRLNTDFHELKFDMGRMFGFAYGEKENGAVFSHMTVMYANALYRRGFAKEGWKALKTLAETALDFDTSRIYPGIPEYFRSDGRGMYHYLTGAASWFMLTMITQVFGVRGEAGDLIFAPRLMGEQFDSQGKASVSLVFAGKQLEVIYENPEHKDSGEYTISSAACEGYRLQTDSAGYAVLPRKVLDGFSGDHLRVTVTLN